MPKLSNCRSRRGERESENGGINLVISLFFFFFVLLVGAEALFIPLRFSFLCLSTLWREKVRSWIIFLISTQFVNNTVTFPLEHFFSLLYCNKLLDMTIYMSIYFQSNMKFFYATYCFKYLHMYLLIYCYRKWKPLNKQLRQKKKQNNKNDKNIIFS